MTKNDKGWAQLNHVTPILGNKANGRISRPPLGFVNKQNIVFRICKAIRLYGTTYYSWKNSWYMAAR